MNLKKILIMGIGALLIGGISVFFFFPQKKEKVSESPAQDRIKYDSALKELATEKKYLKSLAAGLGINYFSRHPESSEVDISFFMFNQISKLANKWRIKLISFSPAEKEEKGDFTKISFVGEIIATYLDMVNFFRELEEKERLIIDNLKISTISTSPRKHRAQFALSCIEFRDQLLQDLAEAEKIYAPTSSQETRVVKNISRDPFFNPLEGTYISSLEPRAQPGYIDLSGEHDLAGIISFPQPRAAIIDHKIVKKGDQINGKEVIDIEQDRVILKRGEQLYVLKLKEIPSPKEEEKISLEFYNKGRVLKKFSGD